MNVLIIGATGGTGDQLVRQLLASNHRVTVFVRSPEKLGQLASRVTIVQGDARNTEALERAVVGQEAVVSALGPRSLGKDNLQEVYLTNLVALLERTGPKRFISLSALGAGSSVAVAPFQMKLLGKTVLKNIYADKNRGEAVVEASSLDYTQVRPGRLLNGPAIGNVAANLTGRGLSSSINRADVAAFMITQLGDTSWIRQSPIIGYPK